MASNEQQPQGATQRLPLIQKEVPEEVPITPESIALFRLGEACNNACPMCTNSGLREAHFFQTEELVRRVDFVHGQGLRRVVITGGEPTIHPGFWDVVRRIGELSMVWDLNTHGRTFATRDYTARAMEEGLQRVIVSLHSHEEKASRIMSGISAKGHAETLQGIKNLLEVGADIIINLVVSVFNAEVLPDFVRYCAQEFGVGYAIKFAFPSLLSQGVNWDPIRIPYRRARESLRQLPEVSREVGIPIQYESFPNCVMGDVGAINAGRLGFGETHYLDDITGDTLYSIAWLEARDSVFGRTCALCKAFSACPGVSEKYAELFGIDELEPFLDGPVPWWF